MQGVSITTLQPRMLMAVGGLHLIVGAATAPRANIHEVTAAQTLAPRILTNLRRMLRITDITRPPWDNDVEALKDLLDLYRQMVTLLERFLEIQQIKPHQRLIELMGTPAQIESVIEIIEEKIEDLEIATNPDIHAGLERLIAEVTSP